MGFAISGSSTESQHLPIETLSLLTEHQMEWKRAHTPHSVYFSDKSPGLSIKQQLKARYLSTRQSRQETLTGLATSPWEKGNNQQQISSNDQTSVSILLYHCISPEISTVRELSIICDKNFKRSLGALVGAIYKLEMLSIILLLMFFLTFISK